MTEAFREYLAGLSPAGRARDEKAARECLAADLPYRNGNTLARIRARANVRALRVHRDLKREV
jgi:hypothetical protein